MTELRHNILTREWVIIATERAKRPHEFASQVPETPSPIFLESCPFCVGNEHLTLPEVMSVRGENGWKVRVVPNKFPALTPTNEHASKVSGIKRSIQGFGVHEVVVENPVHNKIPAFYSQSEWEDTLFVYRQRFEMIRKDKRIQAIVIFQNHGALAGTSVAHPHSQILATPVIPGQVRQRMEIALRHYDEYSECVFCRTMEEELAEKERIIMDTGLFTTLIPYAALSPFHTWIFPKTHQSSFDQITDTQITDLALHLRHYLQKLFYGLKNPAYNFTIRSIPTHEPPNEYLHWYLTIVPRVNVTAGFELGSGMFINTALPEDSARYLREVSIPDAG